MNEQKNNGRGIFYGVIGIATLVVAIVGATFAYFTATASNNIITGNMAKVQLSLAVSKKTTLEDDIGLIPMSNGMVEAAVSNASGKGVCTDDNGNAVCQVYEITLTNSSSAGQFVDGYVALKGGSGTPYDYENYVEGAKLPIDGYANGTNTTTKVGTTMRWAQIFPVYTLSGDTDEDGVCDDGDKSKGAKYADNAKTTPTVETNYEEEDCSITATKYSTAGEQLLGVDTSGVGVIASLPAIGNPNVGKNDVNIRTDYKSGKIISGDTDGDGACDTNGDNALTTGSDKVETDYTESGCTLVQEGDYKGILKNETITGTSYPVIGTNYIRVSNHTWNEPNKPESYTRTNDVTSALVFNNSVAAGAAAKYYVVVWLTENGKNQTASAAVGGNTPVAASFFAGNVTFISAAGSEVSASFTDYTRVNSANAVQQS